MEKLGLIIKITDAGEQEHSSINKESKWAKHASDARIYIKDLEGFDGTSKTTTFVKFIGAAGYLICLVKANPENSGRPFDNTAAWIYIPSDLDITGETLSQILESVDGVISDPIEIKTDKLEDIFSKPYTKKDLQGSVLRQLSSKETGEIALRFYGDNTGYKLNDLLGNDIAQIEYNGCKALFLIDNTSGITPVANKAKIITAPIRKICKIHPPQKNDDGFIPNVKTKEGTIEFSKPIEVTEGTSFNITWKKKGYKDVIKPYTASFNDNDSHLSGVDLTEKDYYLLIPLSRFRIMDSKNRSIDKCIISIEGKPLNQKETPLPALWFEKEVEVKVEKQGYKSYSDKINIKEQNFHIIKLDNIIYTYEFKIPAHNDEGERLDEEAKILITTKENLKESPIKGYKLNNQIFLYDNKVYRGDLKYDINKEKKLKRKYFIRGLITSFLTFYLIMLSIVILKEKDNYKAQFAWPPFVKEKHEEFNTEENDSVKQHTLAIKYLDENIKWEKDSLDKYYSGLFHDINDFNFVKITNESDSILLHSSNFQELVNVATEAMKFKWDIKSNKDFMINDSTINFKKYIKWIKDNTEKLEKEKDK